MYIVAVEVDIYDAKIDEFCDVVSVLSEQSVAKEQGCQNFRLYRSTDSPNEFLVFEVYDDILAFENHAKRDHTTNAGRLIAPMIRSKRVSKSLVE
jgi:autoinducer 2-degrading protein